MSLINARTVIGMDIGKRYSWGTAVSTDTGEVLKEGRLFNSREAFFSFVEGLPRPVRLVMEATGNWQYLYECWEGMIEEIQLAHPLPLPGSRQTESMVESLPILEGLILFPRLIFPPGGPWI